MFYLFKKNTKFSLSRFDKFAQLQMFDVNEKINYIKTISLLIFKIIFC